MNSWKWEDVIMQAYGENDSKFTFGWELLWFWMFYKYVIEPSREQNTGKKRPRWTKVILFWNCKLSPDLKMCKISGMPPFDKNLDPTPINDLGEDRGRGGWGDVANIFHQLSFSRTLPWLASSLHSKTARRLVKTTKIWNPAFVEVKTIQKTTTTWK